MMKLDVTPDWLSKKALSEVGAPHEGETVGSPSMDRTSLDKAMKEEERRAMLAAIDAETEAKVEQIRAATASAVAALRAELQATLAGLPPVLLKAPYSLYASKVKACLEEKGLQ
eukprot:RCo013006